MVIDAFQNPGPDDQETREIPSWVMDAINRKDIHMTDDGSVFIRTMEGEMLCPVGNWIIRGVKGELYSCSPDVFEASYEAI